MTSAARPFMSLLPADLPQAHRDALRAVERARDVHSWAVAVSLRQIAAQRPGLVEFLPTLGDYSASPQDQPWLTARATLDGTAAAEGIIL